MVLIPEVFQLIEYSGPNNYIIFVKNHFSSLGVGIFISVRDMEYFNKIKNSLILFYVLLFFPFEVKQYSETNYFDYVDFTFYLIGLSYFYLVYKNRF